MIIFRTTSISISLVYHRSDRKNRPSHTQSFVLCDIDEELSAGSIGKYENILKSSRGGFTYWTGSLRPGNYILIPFSISFWGRTTSNCDYTIAIHSGIPLDLTIAAEAPTMLSDCLMSAVVKKYHNSTEVCHNMEIIIIDLIVKIFLGKRHNMLFYFARCRIDVTNH